MRDKPKPGLSDDAIRQARLFVDARNRARIRQEVPEGGDPFFVHMAKAEGHWRKLVRLAGTRRAKLAVAEEEAKLTPRYIFGEVHGKPKVRGR
jgi:hypothetical protein